MENNIVVDGNEVGWTFSTLKKYIDQRFKAAEEAISKSEASVEQRFGTVNEFRGALTDLSKTMLSSSVYDVQHKALADRISVNDKRIENLQLSLTELLAKDTGQRQGVSTVGANIMAVMSGLAALASLISILVLLYHMKMNG